MSDTFFFVITGLIRLFKEYPTLNICAFVSRLYGTLFSLTFCSDAEFARFFVLFGQIYTLNKKNHVENAPCKGLYWSNLVSS